MVFIITILNEGRINTLVNAINSPHLISLESF